MALLGGCQHRMGKSGEVPATSQLGTALQERGHPVGGSVAQILESAAPGTLLSYPGPDGQTRSLVLGPVYQSGLQVPCRLARVNARESVGNGPVVYAFCHAEEAWFEMPPVVLGGY